MQIPAGHPLDLLQLHDELAAAGIAVNALGVSGDDLHTYDADGAYLDLPLDAASILAAHVPQPDPAQAEKQAVVAAQVQSAQALIATSSNQQQADAMTAFMRTLGLPL